MVHERKKIDDHGYKSFVFPNHENTQILSFFECSHAQIFCKTFSSWWFKLAKKNITMTLKDIILGLLNRTDIVNYLIILGKLCIWECRKAGIYPDFNIFLKKVKIKFETEKYKIANKNGTFASFRKRWEAIRAKFL